MPGYPGGLAAASPADAERQHAGHDRHHEHVRQVDLLARRGQPLEGYNNYQWYKKPNRGAGTTTTLDSNTAEDDTFAIFQLGWNTVVGGRLVRRHEAELQQHALPADRRRPICRRSSTTRPASGCATPRNTALMFRRRLQITSNWQYSIPELLGGRHDFRGGFDNAYTPEDVTTTRVGNVNLT